MSALGHQRTCAVRKGMPALHPPIANAEAPVGVSAMGQKRIAKKIVIRWSDRRGRAKNCGAVSPESLAACGDHTPVLGTNF
jgi:hypothetical protein